MLATIVHVAPVLAAEKSKVPYYIAGGVLVAWALILSIGIGTRNPNFPSTLAAQRLVIAISAVLVLATVSMAVLTSGGSSAKATIAPVTQTGREAASGAGTSSLKDEADPQGQLRLHDQEPVRPRGQGYDRLHQRLALDAQHDDRSRHPGSRRDAHFPRRDEDAQLEPQARHLRLLLLGSRPSRRRHGRQAHRPVGLRL